MNANTNTKQIKQTKTKSSVASVVTPPIPVVDTPIPVVDTPISLADLEIYKEDDEEEEEEEKEGKVLEDVEGKEEEEEEGKEEEEEEEEEEKVIEVIVQKKERKPREPKEKVPKLNSKEYSLQVFGHYFVQKLKNQDLLSPEIEQLLLTELGILDTHISDQIHFYSTFIQNSKVEKEKLNLILYPKKSKSTKPTKKHIPIDDVVHGIVTQALTPTDMETVAKEPTTTQPEPTTTHKNNKKSKPNVAIVQI